MGARTLPQVHASEWNSNLPRLIDAVYLSPQKVATHDR